MVYLLRDGSDSIDQVVATKVGPDGRATQVPASAVSELATGSWTSPATGVTYSSGWILTLPGGTLTVTPLLADQEVNLEASLGAAYWEGDSVVTGKLSGLPVLGVGYTEINPVH